MSSAAPASATANGIAPARKRNLQTTTELVPSQPHLSVQRHGAPLTPVARSCLWETEVLKPMASWFGQYATAGTELGLGFVCVTRERVVARLRIGPQHQQPAGLLHGGVTALIAEELGSVASAINVAPSPIVGVNVNATHIGSARVGDVVLALCTPIKRGGRLQVWKIDLHIDDDQADESEACKRDPTYYLHLQPKGAQLATCQLTSLARPIKSDADKLKTSASSKPLQSKL